MYRSQMLLIPLFWKGSDKKEGWMHLGVFLSDGGRTFWQVDDSITDKDVEQLLNDNGLPVSKVYRYANTIYAKIDTERLKLNEFYTWNEIDPKNSKLDVWKVIKIPISLWSCNIFRDEVWKNMGIVESKREGIELLF